MTHYSEKGGPLCFRAGGLAARTADRAIQLDGLSPMLRGSGRITPDKPASFRQFALDCPWAV